MDEPEITIYYPTQWDDEYKLIGHIAIWSQDFPEMFNSSTGVLKQPPYSAPGKMENFPNYALMYLLRQQLGIYSITYMRLGAKKSKDGERLQVKMRQIMGDAAVDTLRTAIRAEGLIRGGFEGEPDLFCWQPQTDKWF